MHSNDLLRWARSGRQGTPAANRKRNITHTRTHAHTHPPYVLIPSQHNPIQHAFQIITHMSSAVRRWSLWAGLPHPSTCAIMMNTDMIFIRWVTLVISDKCLCVKEDRGTSGEELGGGASVSSPSSPPPPSWSSGEGGATEEKESPHSVYPVSLTHTLTSLALRIADLCGVVCGVMCVWCDVGACGTYIYLPQPPPPHSASCNMYISKCANALRKNTTSASCSWR